MRSLLKPYRFCLKKTGPLLSSLMASAVASISGDSAISASEPMILSNKYFITTSQSVIGRSNTSSTGRLPT